MLDVPPRKYQNCRMDLQRSSEDLGTFDAKVDSVPLDGGDCGLRNHQTDSLASNILFIHTNFLYKLNRTYQNLFSSV